MNAKLLTSATRAEYLEQVRREIETAERFVLVSAFATADGIAQLEPAMRRCFHNHGTGTLVLALDRQHFNTAELFDKIADLQLEFGEQLELRVVEEQQGLLHAKAVYTKQPDGTSTLIVGSANLTEKAFLQNNELGVRMDMLETPLARDFERFVQTIGGRRFDVTSTQEQAAYLRGIRVSRDRVPRTHQDHPIAPPPVPPWSDVALPPIDVPIDTFISDWLQAGCIVGRGRRGLDVLVIRLPAERLERLGLLQREFRTRLGKSTDKTVTAGHQIRLLPDQEDRCLRDDAHAVQNLLVKLTLNLPCFGLWMPTLYWDLFCDKKAKLDLHSITAEQVRAAAERQQEQLRGPGLEPEVDAMVKSLIADGFAKPSAEGQLRSSLVTYFREELKTRTPDLLARAVGFRTQRQKIHSEMDLRVLARALFADLVQASLSSTYRTGTWPRRFRSHVGRAFAASMAERGVEMGRELNDVFAMELLDRATCWEDEALGLAQVSAEVKALLGDPRDIKLPELAGDWDAADSDDESSGGDDDG